VFTPQVQQLVENDGQYVENEVNAYARKKSYTGLIFFFCPSFPSQLTSIRPCSLSVTHKPVYHKTIFNTYTAHDNIQKDVYHHLHEREVSDHSFSPSFFCFPFPPFTTSLPSPGPQLRR
jgi:hypothetical protein